MFQHKLDTRLAFSVDIDLEGDTPGELTNHMWIQLSLGSV